MAVPAPSLPSHRLVLSKAQLGRRLRERRDAIARTWGSPARFLAGLAVCGTLALVVTGVVVVLVVTSSLLWAPLLAVCGLAWFGLINEFGGRGPAAPVEAPAKKAAAKPATRAASTRQRKTPAATTARKTQTKPA